MPLLDICPTCHGVRVVKIWGNGIQVQDWCPRCGSPYDNEGDVGAQSERQEPLSADALQGTGPVPLPES